MTTAHIVYVHLLKDREGKPRGFEKSDRIFFMTEEEADKALAQDTPERQASFMVVECVIMTEEEYDKLGKVQ